MQEPQHSIDDIFRKSLSDYREAPPAAAWDAIERRLDSEGPRRRGFFWRWPWISLLLLLLVGGAWYVLANYNKDNDSKDTVTASPVHAQPESHTPASTEPSKPTIPPPAIVSTAKPGIGSVTPAKPRTTRSLHVKSSFTGRSKPQPTVPSYANNQRPYIPSSGYKASIATGEPGVQAVEAPLPVPSSSVTSPAAATSVTGEDTEDSTKDDSQAPEEQPKRKKPFPLSVAALAGYEQGFSQPAPNRTVAATRIMWHFNPSWSIGVQPSYRFGTVSSQTLLAQNTYVSASAVQVDSFFTNDTNGTTGKTYHYYISQSFDSTIRSGKTAGGKFWEVELPLLLSYQPSGSNWNVYVGPSFNFGGRLTNSTIGSSQSFTTQRKDSVILHNQQLPSSVFNDYFGNYPQPVIEPEPVLGNPASLRMGYTLGLGYQWRGLMLDLSMHQQLGGYGNVNTRLRNVYASPYLRLSLGYRLLRPRYSARNPSE